VGIGMHGLGEQPSRRGGFDDLAEVHDRNVVADVSNHCKVVGNEEIGKTQIVLQFFEKVEDLCLYRNVECRHWFVENQELGIESERPGDSDSLALPA